MATLKGKTLFITGASRGIGKAIALRAARDGANVVVAAKTAEPHPKLEGTVHTAVEELRSRRRPGPGLYYRHPLRGAGSSRGRQGRREVRRHRHPGQQRQRHQPDRHARDADEALRPDARHQHARHVPDLASSACRTCSRPSNPHILNISPPLSMEPRWFAGSRGLHDGQVRHEHVRAGHGRGVQRAGRGRQRAVAAHRDRHRGGAQPAGRRRGDAPLPQARDHGRRGPRDPDPRQPRVHGQLLHRRRGAARAQA